MKRWLLWQAAGLALAAFLIWMLAASGLDMRLSALAYEPQARAFPLRDAWFTSVLGHKGLKTLSLALWLGMLVTAFASRAWRREALHAALGAALAATAVSVLRGWSAVSCPWDLVEFGGSDPGAGHCLPSGHASSGFALFSGFFALRDAHPRLARWVLALAWALGLVAGVVQVARGAHFVSHALWTAWVAWALNLALYVLLQRLNPPD